MPGVLAIVGRPNVGKSALFNRIAGRRIAIVHDQPGVTRDRIAAEVEWHGRPFTLLDTGGIGLRRGEKAADVIQQAAMEQVDLAIESAHAVLFVVNVHEGLVPLDQEVAARLRSAGKPVLLCVNKSDNESFASNAVDFAALGFGDSFPVSAIHGRGIDPLLRAATRLLPDAPELTPMPSPESGVATGGPADRSQRDFARDPLRLAIIGRPNVGKSSIVNALTRSTRVVVSAIPGTTRDAVDVPFDVETDGRRERYVLVDTAGVRKRKSVGSSIEFFSVLRTEEAIARCDIAVFVLDAGEGIRDQDKKIGALITEARRACIVVVNKWDLVADKVREARDAEIGRRNAGRRKPEDGGLMTTLGEFGEWVQEKLFFLDYAPVIFASAISGFHLDRLLESVRYVAAQLRQQIPTAVLNRALHDAVTRRQPVSSRGSVLKFYYATQIGHSPPRFVLFVNRTDIFNRTYEKYLSDSIRSGFGYEGCPLILIPRNRPKTIEPMRKEPAREGSRKGPKPGPKAGPKAEEKRRRKGSKGGSQARARSSGRPGRRVMG